MSAVISISAGRRYGTARVCRAWRVSRSSLYRGRLALPQPAPRRQPGPQGPMPDAESRRSGRRSPTAPFTVRATARSGRGCAMLDCAHRRSAFAA